MIWPSVDRYRTEDVRKVRNSYAKNTVQVSNNTAPLVTKMIVINFRRIGVAFGGIG